jgi:hypothetical protein
LVLLPNVILVIISRRKMSVDMWQVWGKGGGILWFVVGKLGGTNKLEVQGIDERKILNGSPRNG